MTILQPSIRRESLTKEDELHEFQNSDKKLPYPKSVFFIVVTEFCERFSYYGMRAVLTIYMRNVLNFSDDLSTTIYHVFLLLCYGLPVFGGILADSFIGKYRTIVYLSSIYALGNIVLTAASTKPLHLPVVPLSLLGLGLMAIGTGGIKPCVVALGGEQFRLPNQEKTLKQFFSVFLFAVSVGNMVATVITPVLRRDVECFGDETCYPLAFGVPGALMIIAISVFVGGRCLYTIKTPDENIIVQVFKCSIFAIKEKFSQKKNSEKKFHWLDYGRSGFSDNLIRDTKGLFRVLVYYLPVPMFFALYEQLGSRWTLQATRMNGYIGSFAIKPDQMQVANAILLFIFIPVFETLVYPLFHKCNFLKRPLQKMVIGGILASLSFLSAGIVETKIHNTYSVLNTNHGEIYLNFINTISFPVIVSEQSHHYTHTNSNSPAIDSSTLLTFKTFEPLTIPVESNLISRPLSYSVVDLSFGVNDPHIAYGMNLTLASWKGQLNLLPSGGLQSVVIADFNGSIVVNALMSSEDTAKSKEGNAKLRLLVNYFPKLKKNYVTRSGDTNIKISLVNKFGENFTFELNSNHTYDSLSSPIFLRSSLTRELEPDTYKVMVQKTKNRNSSSNGQNEELELIDEIILNTGGSYIFVINNMTQFSEKKNTQLLTITPPNEVHMLWLLPQYVLIAWAEVLFIISGMEFSFTEAPASMKSVVQSCWHLANAVGNAIVIISAQLNLEQKYEFFGFSVLMAVDTFVLCLMAMKYTYVNQKEDSTSTLGKTQVAMIEEESTF